MTQQTQFTKAVGNASEINELLRRYGVKFGIYKNGVFTLGSGNDLSFPIVIDSNANNSYVVDKNGISIFTSKNGMMKRFRN